MSAPTTRPERLHFTGNEEADRLIASDPLALLIGFELDQQVPLQWAFSAPLELRRRIGDYDARRLATMDPDTLDEAFRRKPSLHRFPGNMARRVRELAEALVRDYDGQPERVWAEATDGHDLERRLLALPGIGDMKAKTLIAILGKRYGVQPQGWEAVAPTHPTLGDVDSDEARERYQASKRAYKAELRAQGKRV